MLDIKFVRENLELVKQKVASKNVKIDFDKLISLDEEKRQMLTSVENLKATRNKATKEIARLKKEKQDASEMIKEMRNIGDQISEMDHRIKEKDEEIHEIMMQVPNLPNDSVPVGKNELDNQILKQWGEKKNFDFKALDHLELAEKHGLMDFKRASRMSGSGFPLYTGRGATLERALINYMLDFHVNDGYIEMIPPIMALPTAMEGTAQLPKLKEDMYYCPKDNLYLIPTAEVTITNYHREEILSKKELPKYFCGYTPCFRREAGSYGKDTRGLLRIHQFNKVEMVKLVEPENSYAELEDLLNRVERILQNLNIPYQVLTLCTGDLSFGAAKCYDIETWSVCENKYLEASSCSNFEDFQARRMNLRYRKEEKAKPEFVHTLNGSGLATSRLMVSLLENNQNADGSITVPKVLQKYTGFEIIK